jgi:hypothetical protein
LPSNDGGMPVALGVPVVVDDVGTGEVVRVSEEDGVTEADGVAVGAGENDGVVVGLPDIAAVVRGTSTG